MSKVTLSRLSSLVNGVTAINGVITEIESAFDNTLSRDGDSPNQLTATLDVNGRRVYNLPAASSVTEPVRLLEFQQAVLGTYNGDNTTTSVGSLAGLRAVDPADLNYIRVLGHTTAGDGGEGDFYSVTGQPAATYTDNGGTIIVPTGGDGSSAWIRKHTKGRVEVPWFGAFPIGDDMDCIDAINAALAALTVGNSISGFLVFPATPYAMENKTWYNVSEAVVIGDGAKQIDLTIEGAMPGAPQEFEASTIARLRTSSLTDDTIRIEPWVGHAAHIRFQNICIDGWDTTGSCIYASGGQLTGPVLDNVQLIWGANGFRVGSNLVSPHFRNVSYFRNTVTGLLVEDEIDNGVFFHNIFQSGDLHAIKVTGDGFFIGSAFIYSVIEDLGDNFIICEDCSPHPFQDVKFDGVWIENPAAGKSIFKIAATSPGLYFVKFKDVHFGNRLVNPVDFIETESSATNVSQFLFFEQCDFENMGAGNILTVDTDPSAAGHGGYQNVTMSNSWFPGMTNPKGCYPPALTGTDPVQYIGFVPATNSVVSQQPEYILDSTFYTRTRFHKALSLPTPTSVSATTYTVLDSDQTIILSASASCTLTLPSAASYPGRFLNLTNRANFTVVSASSNVVPIGGGSAATAILAANGGSGAKWAVLQSDGTNWQIIQSN